MHTWKCHNGTPCTAFLNKQKGLFLKNKGQEGKHVLSGVGEGAGA
jgi:hypothetical protein